MALIGPGIHYDINNRWITIGKRIKPITATHFENALKKITAADFQKPIIVFLHGVSGGDVYACLKIYELIESNSAPIFTVAVDIAFSGFFYILQAGYKRFATSETKLIFHRAVRFFDNQDMNAADLFKEAEFLLTFDSMQIVIFCKQGRPLKQVIKLFRRGATLDSAKALKLKLIDGVIKKSAIKNMCAQILNEVKK